MVTETTKLIHSCIHSSARQGIISITFTRVVIIILHGWHLPPTHLGDTRTVGEPLEQRIGRCVNVAQRANVMAWEIVHGTIHEFLNTFSSLSSQFVNCEDPDSHSYSNVNGGISLMVTAKLSTHCILRVSLST